MKLICNVRPSAYTCRICIDMQENNRVLEDCGKCEFHNTIYEILDFKHGLFTGTYALLLHNGKVEKVPINRLYNIRSAASE